MGKRKTLDHDGVWRPKKFYYEFTNERLTTTAGLGPVIDVYSRSPQYPKLKECIPKRSGNASYDSMQFALTLLGGFWHGYDCIEDLEKFEDKPDVMAKLQSIPSARAIGDFLREFNSDHIEKLNQHLTQQGLAARKQLAPEKPLILDQDSTTHVQCGEKIEGLGKNYKGEWGLESLDSFDELGFSYGFRLREGGTFSSVGAPAEIKRIFSHLPKEEKKFYRADSAFCNEEVVTACMEHKAKFTITAHGNTLWEEKIPTITNWEKWKYSEEELKQAEIRKEKLPEIELGSFVYQPGWAENLRFYVVVKKTKVSVKDGANLFEHAQGGLRYWGVLTNWNLYERSKQEVIEFHSKRGNSENFIKEQKISFDLKHFPCIKLNANHAYGLLGMVSHNFLRAISHLDNPDKPHYAKKLRHTYIILPGKLVEHARKLVLRIPVQFRKEVELMTTGWAGTLEAALAMG